MSLLLDHLSIIDALINFILRLITFSECYADLVLNPCSNLVLCNVHVKFLLRFLHVGRLAQIGKDSRESCTNCRRLSALQSTHQHLVQAFLSWREGL